MWGCDSAQGSLCSLGMGLGHMNLLGCQGVGLDQGLGLAPCQHHRAGEWFGRLGTQCPRVSVPPSHGDMGLGHARPWGWLGGGMGLGSQEMEAGGGVSPMYPPAGCPAKKTLCDASTCHNGGTCVHEWDSFSCRCPLGFGGKTCQEGKGGGHRGGHGGSGVGVGVGWHPLYTPSPHRDGEPPAVPGQQPGVLERAGTAHHPALAPGADVPHPSPPRAAAAGQRWPPRHPHPPGVPHGHRVGYGYGWGQLA